MSFVIHEFTCIFEKNSLFLQENIEAILVKMMSKIDEGLDF